MKKAYETPCVEVVKFEYKDQVVATSGCTTGQGNAHTGTNSCDVWQPGGQFATR